MEDRYTQINRKDAAGIERRVSNSHLIEALGAGNETGN